MGRDYYRRKAMVEESIKLSIYRLKKLNLLDGNHNTTMTWTHSQTGHKSSVGVVVDVLDVDEPYVKLNYTLTNRNSGNKTDYDYAVSLVTTDCNFGGVRYWFICPLVRNGVPCGRRVGTLFLSSGGKYFGCRHCYDLSYESRNECRLGRFGQLGYVLKAERQVEELREKVKRWTWRGRPTRKARRINAITRRIESYPSGVNWESLLI